MQTVNEQRIAIVGMGALGIMYGALLEQVLGPKRVTVIADAHRLERYRASRISCNAYECQFAFSTAEQYGGYADIVFVGVKSTALQQAIELMRPIVGPDTVIVSLLNGISSEEIIEHDLCRGQVLYCVAQGMDALRQGTSVTYQNEGVLCLGLPKGQEHKQPALERVEDLLRFCHIAFVHESDIIRRQWCKWMLNIGINQTVMVHEATFAAVQRPGAIRDEFIAAMKEVVDVAQRSQVDVRQEDLQEYLALADTLNPEGMPSMRQDGLAHRATEVEIFSGTLLKKARQLGVPVPVNASLYERICRMQEHYLKQ